ncbi:hypothetical protein Prudu_016558, partial [Prunus dulcis]
AKIEENEIVSEGSTQVGFFNFFNGFNQMLTGVRILKNKIYALEASEMSRLTILISGGRWVDSRYENFKAKAVLVSNTITLKELQKHVYDIVNVDPNDYEITIIAMYETMKKAWPVEIADDDDVRAFIFESRLRPYKIPLCITLEDQP